MSKELTLKICPTAICKKDGDKWCIYENERCKDPVTTSTAPAKAWEEAFLSLDPNWLLIPGRLAKIVKNDNGWEIGAFNSYWHWVSLDDKTALKDCTYRVKVEQYEGCTHKDQWYWHAWADDYSPLYGQFTTNECHKLREDCLEEIKSVVDFFELNAYEEIIHIEKRKI